MLFAKVICPLLPVNERTPFASGKSRVSLTPTSVSRAIPGQSISKFTVRVEVLIVLATRLFRIIEFALIELAARDEMEAVAKVETISESGGGKGMPLIELTPSITPIELGPLRTKDMEEATWMVEAT